MGGFSRLARSTSGPLKRTAELTDMLCEAISYVESRGRVDIAEYLMGEVEDIVAMNCRSILDHGVRHTVPLLVPGDIVRLRAPSFLPDGQLVKVGDVTEGPRGVQEILIIKLQDGTTYSTTLRSSDVEKVDPSLWKDVIPND